MLSSPTYGEPFANALVRDDRFRAWVLGQTKFAAVADEATVIHEAMLAKRGKGTPLWWNSHYSEKCRCEGDCGQETDLLAIFDTVGGFRFALHFEVKQPRDRFDKKRDQAANYARRAACWVTNPPSAIVQHDDAATVLLCSATRLAAYEPHVAKFGSVILFENIALTFPHATRMV